MSLRDAILNADDFQSKPEDVPEWGVKIMLREMSGPGRNKFFEIVEFDKDNKAPLVEMYAAAIALSARDPETGELIFTPEDKQALMEKSATVIERLGKAALVLSGLAPNSRDDAEKN